MKNVLVMTSFILLFLTVQHSADASPPHLRRSMAKSIDESKRVSLRGNVPPEARSAKNRVRKLSASHHFSHLQLLLKRSPETELALRQRIENIHDPKSPEFQKWLSVDDIRTTYGPSESDIAAVSIWLSSHGFQIDAVHPNGMIVEFSGNLAEVENAFQTEVYELDVNNTSHISNISDISIPLGLADVVTGLVSLNDFFPTPLAKPSPQYTFGDLGQTKYGLVPGDIATIYSITPLFQKGLTGKGQTIVLIENSLVYNENDYWTFRNRFGLSAYPHGGMSQVHPPSSGETNNCVIPPVRGNGFALEATLDAQWASAAAPDAQIILASCADTQTTFGGLIALQNLLNSANPPSIVSVSFGQCETRNGAARNAAYYAAYQQAAAMGTSVFVSAGDSGPASCDQGTTAASNGITVNGLASTPYNVAVGGTDFADKYFGSQTTYWNSQNNSDYSSALSYMPEIPWNSTCANRLFSIFSGFSFFFGSTSLCNQTLGTYNRLSKGAGGGGPSACATGAPSAGITVSGTCAGYDKPAWQSMLGVPNDSVRDLPDVSLFAGNGMWDHSYVVCYSNLSDGGRSCSGEPGSWSGAGGTSFGAPILAGMQALINQYTAGRNGNVNPAFYETAAAQYGPSGNPSCNSTLGNFTSSNCSFYDITLGDTRVPCTGSANCYTPEGTYGVSSTSSSIFDPVFEAKTGWDFATGIGTPNAQNLLRSFAKRIDVPRFTSNNFIQAEATVLFSSTVTTAGFPNSLPIRLSYSGFLPTGVIFSDAGNGTATISGTPVLGSGRTYNFSVNASNNVESISQNYSLVVREKPQILTSSTPRLVVLQEGQVNLQSTGFPSPTISTNSVLPAGVSLVNQGNGSATIQGIPDATTPGSYPITIVSQNELGSTNLNIELLVLQSPKMTSEKNAIFSVSTQGSFAITTNGFPLASVSISSPLPNGLQFTNADAGTGTISGSPPAASKGMYPLQVTLNNGIQTPVLDTINLVVGEAIVISGSTQATFQPTQSVNISMTAAGYPIPACTTASQLPAGLQLTDNKDGTLRISGILGPSSWGIYPVTIDCKNNYFPDANHTITFSVYDPLAIISSDVVNFKVGQELVFTIKAQGYPVPTVSIGSILPQGLYFQGNLDGTGIIRGTPEPGSEGDYRILVTAQSTGYGQTSQYLTLSVKRAPTITSPDNVVFKAGAFNSFTITTQAYPTARVVLGTRLPLGLSFLDNLDGTATIFGTPQNSVSGTHTISLSAANGIISNASQTLSLSILKSVANETSTPASIPTPPPPTSGCSTWAGESNHTWLYLISIALFLAVLIRMRKKPVIINN